MSDDGSRPGPRKAAPAEPREVTYQPPFAFICVQSFLYLSLIVILCIHIRVVLHDYWRTLAARRRGAPRVSARTKWLSDRMTLLLVLLNATWLLEAAMAAFWGAMALLTDRWWSMGTKACDWFIVGMLQLYCGGFAFLFLYYHTRWRIIHGAAAERESWPVRIANGLIAVYMSVLVAVGFLVRGQATADGRCHIRRAPAFFILVTVSYVSMFLISSILLHLFVRPIHETLRRATEAGTPNKPGDDRLRATMRRNLVAVAVTCSVETNHWFRPD